MTEQPIDLQRLNRSLDQTKAKLFMGKGAGFYAPLFCQLDFYWSREIGSAATNFVNISFNPDFWEYLPEDTRMTVLLHEVGHVFRMHDIRRGDREPLLWNWACDVRINNDLRSEGFSFKGTSPWIDSTLGDKPEEEIYDLMYPQFVQGQMAAAIDNGAWGPSAGGLQQNDNGHMTGDLFSEPEDMNALGAVLLNTIMTSVHSAKQAGCAGDIPGSVELLVNQFLAPKVAWEAELQQFFNDLLEAGRSWKKRNRRFRHVYMPDTYMDVGALEHIAFFADTSGSMTDAMIFRIASEAKYVFEQFNPEKLTFCLFDDDVHTVFHFEKGDEFTTFTVHSRAGTSGQCVHDWMEEHKPNSVVVAGDMGWNDCWPALPSYDVNLLWLSINNVSAQPPYGRIVHAKG